MSENGENAQVLRDCFLSVQQSKTQCYSILDDRNHSKKIEPENVCPLCLIKQPINCFSTKIIIFILN